MEHPVLISQCNEYHKTNGHDPQKGYLAASKTQRNTSTGGQPIADCPAGLRSALECYNLPQLTQNIILSSWWNSPLSIYSSTWVRWQKFCMDKGILNTHTTTNYVLEFFKNLYTNGSMHACSVLSSLSPYLRWACYFITSFN